MRRQQCVLFYAALALTVLLVLESIAPVAGQDEGPGERLVLALYRADITWTMWVEQPCDLPPDLYVSTDGTAVERHVREALAVGIDAFVQPWHGPSLDENPTAANFLMLLEQAASLGFAAAVQVDLTSPLLDTSDEVLRAIEVLRDDLAQRPGYLTVDGRPVVLFLEQQVLPLSTWEALRGRVDPGRQMIWIAEGESTEALAVFDGLYLFDSDRAASLDSLLPQWGAQVRAWAQAHGVRRYWAATTMPGYDDRLLLDADEATVVSRRAGATYRNYWAAADTSDPDWILIRSFNEWDRCTHIERSVANADSYMELTAELVRQYRSAAAPATATLPAPEPSATSTPPEPPELVPPTIAITDTVEPSATPAIPPTATPVPSATPFRLATPTPPAVPYVAPLSVATQAVTVIPQAWQSTPAGVASTATPRPRPVVEGDEPRSCVVLPLLLTAVICWGTRRRNG